MTEGSVPVPISTRDRPLAAMILTAVAIAAFCLCFATLCVIIAVKLANIGPTLVVVCVGGSNMAVSALIYVALLIRVARIERRMLTAAQAFEMLVAPTPQPSPSANVSLIR